MILHNILPSIGFTFLLVLSIEFKFVQSVCITPDGRIGVCTVVSECPYLMNMLRTNDRKRSKHHTKFLLNSHCGQTSRLPKMCCASLSTIRKFRQESTDNEKHCETADGGSGMCVDIGKCPKLWKQIDTRSHYSCKMDSTTKNHVCCPKESITIGFLPYPATVFFATIPSPSTLPTTPSTSIYSTTVTTTIKTSSDCLTPDGIEGKCVGIESCEQLKKIIDGPRPLTSRVNDFIRNSTCDGDQQYSVCCQTVWDPKSLLPAENTCGINADDDRIYGGKETSIDQYPWMVLIDQTRPTGYKSVCGGSLINSRYVVTAAHCNRANLVIETVRIGDFDTKTLIDCQKVSGGDNDCNEPFLRVRIEEFIIHPQYNIINDIALIRMIRDIPFTDFISPICLPNSDITVNFPKDKNLTFTVAGWGATENASQSDVKMHVILPYYADLTTCAEINNVSIDNTIICAGGEANKDSCAGDSGGPLMYNRENRYDLVGIVSSGPSPCGQRDRPAIYTKVFEFKDWILSQLRP
ncbi:phenoloxidase-activating factor 3-like isoform X2 [Arctopsyche grandis]|uniref:phenoloxidase-activating factor 3-like isoform X2 n=1 Tax=Arctopsyche grandis TaxID=121162 RepID=UPI00406D7980